MKQKIAYRYSVLRYVHDPSTEEFLNIGVLLHSPEKGFLKFRGTSDTRRLSAAFAGIDLKYVRDALGKMAVAFEQRQGATATQSIEKIRGSVLPVDDSSFQWRHPAPGLPRTWIPLSSRFSTDMSGVTKGQAARAKNKKPWEQGLPERDNYRSRSPLNRSMRVSFTFAFFAVKISSRPLFLTPP